MANDADAIDLMNENARLKARLARVVEALRKLTVDAALQGRAFKGNTELPGCEEFYKGYNAGIDTQFKYASEIATAALAVAAQPEEWAYCTVCKKYECICAEPEQKL